MYNTKYTLKQPVQHIFIYHNLEFSVICVILQLKEEKVSCFVFIQSTSMYKKRRFSSASCAAKGSSLKKDKVWLCSLGHTNDPYSTLFLSLRSDFDLIRI